MSNITHFNCPGPLKYLKNEWKFKEINNNTQLEFYIDFELKNPILNAIMKKSFELGLNKIAKAFEERAIKIYNVKKGQFLAPWDMANVIKKIADSGNKNILVTERGASFGYNTLVSDMRSLPIMAKNGYPVIFDATHSVQQPGGQGESSGGQREFVEYLARAAVAVGVAGVFIETHQDPDNAPSDGPNMVPLDKLENLLNQLNDIDNLIKK